MAFGATDLLVSRLARPQCGLISRPQLLALGLTKRAIQHRCTTGRLQVALPGVYRLPGVPQSLEADLWTVVLWCGDGSAISHATAARRWNFENFRTNLCEISTTKARRCSDVHLASGRRVVVHRVDQHLECEVTSIDGLPVTTPRRTLLDLCGRKDGRVGRLLDQGLRDGRLEISTVWLYLEQEWMRGRRGVAVLRELLVERTPGKAPSDSDLELELRRLIIRSGLQAPIHQFEIRIPQATIHLDLAYPEHLLAIEIDSYSWHMDRRSFERDRERDNELSSLGWRVLRFTWAKLRYEPTSVVGLIERHLKARPFIPSVHLDT